MPPFPPHLGLLSIPPCLARCNASFPYSRMSLMLPRTVCPFPAYLHREATRVAAEYARVRGAVVKVRESMGKKCYNAQDRAGYSATLDAAGMAALNPRCGGNSALLLDVSRRARGGALGLLSIPPSLPCCNASFPYSPAYRPMPRAVCPSRAYLHPEAARGTAEYGKLCGALDDMLGSMGKKRYNA